MGIGKKRIDYVEWVDEYAPLCKGCREKIYAKRNPPEEPPCETCRVELMPENKEAVDVYLLCRNQVLTAGMDGTVIDINFPAVYGAMDRYPGGIKDQWDCLLKVRSLFHHFRPKKGEE